MKKKVMSANAISAAKRRMKALERQLSEVGSVMRGTIVTNGQKHRQPYFSLNKEGRTLLMYLGEARLPAARKLSDNYQRMVRIAEEMTIVNMALLKNDAIG